MHISCGRQHIKYNDPYLSSISCCIYPPVDHHHLYLPEYQIVQRCEGYYLGFPLTVTSKIPLIALAAVFLNQIYFSSISLLLNSITLCTYPLTLRISYLVPPSFDLFNRLLNIAVYFPRNIPPAPLNFYKIHSKLLGLGFYTSLSRSHSKKMGLFLSYYLHNVC